MDKAVATRAERTREALLSAGCELMLDRSVDAIPIDDLVAAAGVGKGSFFNHFGDKAGFKAAIAIQIRAEIEEQIGLANHNVKHPVERLAGGMREVTDYALRNRKRTVAMLRMSVGATTSDYPLNEGVIADIQACAQAKHIRFETMDTAVIYWLGLSVAMVTYVVENNLSRKAASDKLRELTLLGLGGLGVRQSLTKRIADQSADQLLRAR